MVSESPPKTQNVIMAEGRRALGLFLVAPDTAGVTRNIICDGINGNERVCLSDDPETCDYIIFVNAYHDQYRKYSSKIIVFDYRDDPGDLFSQPCLRYFKRSVVNKTTQKLVKYNRHVIPIKIGRASCRERV